MQSVLGDAALVEVAKRSRPSREQLEQIRGVGAGSRAGAARSSWTASQRAASARPSRRRESRGPPPQPEDAPLIALAEALLRARAREAGLAYELSPRVPTCRRSSPRAPAASEPTCARCGLAARARRRELLELLAARVSLSVAARRGDSSRIERDAGPDALDR